MATLAYIVIIAWFLFNIITNLLYLGDRVEITPGVIVTQVIIYTILVILLFQI